MTTRTLVPHAAKTGLIHRVQILEEAKLNLIASIEQWMIVAAKNSRRTHQQQMIIKHLEMKSVRAKSADKKILAFEKQRIEDESLLQSARENCSWSKKRRRTSEEERTLTGTRRRYSNIPRAPSLSLTPVKLYFIENHFHQETFSLCTSRNGLTIKSHSHPSRRISLCYSFHNGTTIQPQYNATMHYTAKELADDPVPDSPTWSSEKAYYKERALILERLAEALHPLMEDTSTNNDDDSISSSISEPDSDTSTVIAPIPDKPLRRASSFFTSAFASTSFISILSPSPRTTLTFRSPQTGTFSFQDSPRKADSVMGSPGKFASPIKFSSPSMFKRENKKAKTIEREEGVKVKERDIFQYFKTATVEKKDVCVEKRSSINSSIGSWRSKRSSTTSKNSLTSSSTIVDSSSTNHTRAIDTSNANYSTIPNSITSPKIKTPDTTITELAIQSDTDVEAKQYVIERLGRSVVEKSQPISYQYNFVMAQLDKTRQLVLEADGNPGCEDVEMTDKIEDDVLMMW
ncbi:hypothetical protein E4T39_07884 [Aureobasidium subglaciale]|nr:hypothetical protein E4T39_07884 [Aureobasidium subglaciale]